MTINIHGGGSQTNVNGLRFEQVTRLSAAVLEIPGYEIIGNTVQYHGKEVAKIGSQARLYKVFLEPSGVNYKEIISKQIRPDEAIYVYSNNTMFIIEKKFQNCAGSVDEKLQTCDFKKKQYQKLFEPLGYKVEYMYVLNDWFRQLQYDDVKEYIHSVGCKFYFNEIPLNILGLPHNEGENNE